MNTYIAMQMRCLAESMCSIILRDSLALQCGLRHFWITLTSAVCAQHGRSALITKFTSFNRGKRFFCRKYQLYSKSVDNNSVDAKNPYFKNVTTSIRIMNVIEKQKLRTNLSEENNELSWLCRCKHKIKTYSTPLIDIGCSAWNGHQRRSEAIVKFAMEYSTIFSVAIQRYSHTQWMQQWKLPKRSLFFQRDFVNN